MSIFASAFGNETTWCGSSVWLECRPVTPEVASSSLVRTARSQSFDWLLSFLPSPNSRPHAPLPPFPGQSPTRFPLAGHLNAVDQPRSAPRGPSPGPLGAKKAGFAPTLQFFGPPGAPHLAHPPIHPSPHLPFPHHPISHPPHTKRPSSPHPHRPRPVFVYC